MSLVALVPHTAAHDDTPQLATLVDWGHVQHTGDNRLDFSGIDIQCTFF